MSANRKATGNTAAPGTRRLLWMGCVALVGLPLLSARVDPFDYEGGSSRDELNRMERNSSAMATLLGEFRTSLSDILFIKTERYLHSGVAYVPHMDKSLLSVDGLTQELTHHQEEVETGCTQDHDHAEHDHAEHDHADHDLVKALIPEARDDFRGFVGHLERRVRPWNDPSKPHTHTDGKQLLPWFRVMTLSDRHYVRGYSVGSWWLIHRNVDEAIAFAQEGLEHNPAAFEIRYILGQCYLNRSRIAERQNEGPAAVLEWMRKAKDAYVEATEDALRQKDAMDAERAAGGMGWSKYQEEDAMASARMAVMFERKYGDPALADRLAQRLHKAYPEDEVLRRFASGGPNS